MADPFTNPKLIVLVERLLPDAAKVAVRSPCAKSQRGAIVFDSDGLIVGRGFIIGRGFNAQPKPFACDGSDACRSSCAKLCEHAEQAAIRDSGRYAQGAHMLHVKVIRGVAVPSGEPSCWQCSRAILAAGIQTMWLLHDDGVRGYTAADFHRLTWQHERPDVPLSEVR
jgi:deoxycytidylate deaminase